MKLRNELSRNDAFFSARDREKKERDPSKFDYLLYFFSNRDPVKMVSPFRLFRLFFTFRLSFSSFDKCVKEAAPFEREQSERTSSPSFFGVFSPIIKSHHKTRRLRAKT